MGNQMVFKRYELKYLMTAAQRDSLLRCMEPYMTADRFGHSSIRNLYYDTPSWRLVRDSLDRPFYKEKLRVRSYGRADQRDLVFVELKKKYDSVVYKRRMELPLQTSLESLAGYAPLPLTQIGREVEYFLDYYGNLEPRVFLSYERDAFRARDDSDFRVTFDENIRYRTEELTLDSDPWGWQLLDPDTVLMELKVSDAIPMWMVQALSREKIYKTTFSKYGTAYLQMQCSAQKGVLPYAG